MTTVATDDRRDDRAVNERVRAELGRLDWTQQQLAEHANRPSSWLNDRLKLRARWTVRDVTTVAAALGVPRSTLLPDPSED